MKEGEAKKKSELLRKKASALKPLVFAACHSSLIVMMLQLFLLMKTETAAAVSSTQVNVPATHEWCTL